MQAYTVNAAVVNAIEAGIEGKVHLGRSVCGDRRVQLPILDREIIGEDNWIQQCGVTRVISNLQASFPRLTWVLTKETSEDTRALVCVHAFAPSLYDVQSAVSPLFGNPHILEHAFVGDLAESNLEARHLWVLNPGDALFWHAFPYEDSPWRGVLLWDGVQLLERNLGEFIEEDVPVWMSRASASQVQRQIEFADMRHLDRIAKLLRGGIRVNAL